MTPEERDANFVRFAARQAGHHFLLRALLSAHPNRALVLEAFRAESEAFAKECREGKMPQLLQEPVSEEIVAWLALLA